MRLRVVVGLVLEEKRLVRKKAGEEESECQLEEEAFTISSTKQMGRV